MDWQIFFKRCRVFSSGVLGEFRRKLQSTKTHDLNLPWVWPPLSNNHHQDFVTVLVGNPNQNLHLPLLLGGGHTQILPICRSSNWYFR